VWHDKEEDQGIWTMIQLYYNEKTTMKQMYIEKETVDRPVNGGCNEKCHSQSPQCQSSSTYFEMHGLKLLHQQMFYQDLGKLVLIL